LGSEIYHLSYIPQKLQELGIDTEKQNWREKLGQAMFLLNFDGVESRYGKGEAKTFRQLNYQYQYTQEVPLVQVLKSLQCWLYQCLEGNVPDTKLYKLFDHDVQLYLMEKIIDQMPEYRKAKWG
jgi:hypothetical protein